MNIANDRVVSLTYELTVDGEVIQTVDNTNPMGYGANSVVHTEKLLTLSNDLPVVVELVDEERKIKGFLETMQKFMPKSKFGALITLEKVNVLHYKPSKV